MFGVAPRSAEDDNNVTMAASLSSSDMSSDEFMASMLLPQAVCGASESLRGHASSVGWVSKGLADSGVGWQLRTILI